MPNDSGSAVAERAQSNCCGYQLLNTSSSCRHIQPSSHLKHVQLFVVCQRVRKTVPLSAIRLSTKPPVLICLACSHCCALKLLLFKGHTRHLSSASAEVQASASGTTKLHTRPVLMRGQALADADDNHSDILISCQQQMLDKDAHPGLMPCVWQDGGWATGVGHPCKQLCRQQRNSRQWQGGPTLQWGPHSDPVPLDCRDHSICTAEWLST